MARRTGNQIGVAGTAGSILLACVAPASAAIVAMGGSHHSRDVDFRITFAARDVVWFGDPTSPAASMFPKPDAKPIATDVRVTTTTTEQAASPARRYFNEARLAKSDDRIEVYAFTAKREKLIGTVDAGGNFVPNAFFQEQAALLPTWPRDSSHIRYDDQAGALYVELDLPGPVPSQTYDFLPLNLTNARGTPVVGTYTIEYTPPSGEGMHKKDGQVILQMDTGRGKPAVLAKAIVPRVFDGADVEIGSFDNRRGTYLSDAVYRSGAVIPDGAEPSVTVTVAGEFTWMVNALTENLVFSGGATARASKEATAFPSIAIDGKFDEWRNIAGIDDRAGDLVPYLDYVPDVDILEFKVAHDTKHIYFYVRVAGQVGRTHPAGGRSYFYVYMDVDANPETGYLPSRDDECYFGVDLGDDCEVQFEFVNNALRKTFYGFCGLGGDENVLAGKLTLGKSQYHRRDAAGKTMPNYKVEYTLRGGKIAMTKDGKEGSTDTITLAISPDGHEVEVASTLDGFLKNPQGRPIVQLGQTIDLAVGMECDSKVYPNKQHWGADNTVVIRGYTLTREPSTTLSVSKARK